MFKRLIIFIAVFAFALPALSHTQNNWQSSFEKANELFDKENYTQAKDLYLELTKDINNSWELYYNLGNSYHLLSDYPNAVYYFEKALLLAPKQEQIKTNLDHAKSKLKDDITIIHKYEKQDIIHQTLGKFTPDQWAINATIIGVLFLLFFLIYYFNKNGFLQRIAMLLMILCIILGAASIYAAKFEQDYHATDYAGLIWTEQTNLQQSPSSTAEIIQEIHKGTKVYILQEKGIWYLVKLDNQQKGWLLKSSIKVF